MVSRRTCCPVAFGAMDELEELRGKHVVFLSWRDTRNPEGGGAERYLETMAAGPAWPRGAQVTIFCAAHAGRTAGRGRRRHPVRAPRHQAVGLRSRACGRCAAATWAGRTWSSTSRTGCRSSPGCSPGDRWSCWSTTCTASSGRSSTPGSPAGSAGGSSAGWRPGSTGATSTSPCRGPPATSCASSASPGPGSRSCTTAPTPTSPVTPGKAAHPMVAVVGRLVPHKQVEHAIDAAVELRERWPDLRLHVVGSGWWEGRLHEYVAEQGAEDVVVFEGHVDEERKHELYEQCVAAGAAVAQGGLGPGGRRGRHARHADGGLPQRGRDPRVGRRRAVRRLVDEQGRVHGTIGELLDGPEPSADGSGTAALGDEPRVLVGTRAALLRPRRPGRAPRVRVDAQDPEHAPDDRRGRRPRS